MFSVDHVDWGVAAINVTVLLALFLAITAIVYGAYRIDPPVRLTDRTPDCFCASSSWRRSSGLPVSAVHTSVGPIASTIFASGHWTTVTNGNMNSFFTTAASGASAWMTVGSR